MNETELYIIACTICGIAGITVGLTHVISENVIPREYDWCGILMFFSFFTSIIYWFIWVGRTHEFYDWKNTSFSLAVTAICVYAAAKSHKYHDGLLIGAKSTALTSVLLTSILIISYHLLGDKYA